VATKSLIVKNVVPIKLTGETKAQFMGRPPMAEDNCVSGFARTVLFGVKTGTNDLPLAKKTGEPSKFFKEAFDCMSPDHGGC